MKQYCRYCAFCHESEPFFCNVKEELLSEAQVKRENHCKSFAYTLMGDVITGKQYKSRKQAYLVSHYGYHTCSECGVRYNDNEYYEFYCLDKIMRLPHINCKKCGAELAEKPKRCYWNEHNPDLSCACGESTLIDGLLYCSRQLTARREELRSWGAYYSCPCYKPPQEEFLQLSFF